MRNPFLDDELVVLPPSCLGAPEPARPSRRGWLFSFGEFAAIVLIGMVVGALLNSAFAAESAVVIPWGNWIADLAVGLGGVIVAGIGWALRFVPAAVRQAAGRLLGERVDQILGTPQNPGPAIVYAINAVVGPLRGRALSVDLGWKVANEALAYFTRHAPQLLSEIGERLALEKILGRLVLEDGATPKLDDLIAARP